MRTPRLWNGLVLVLLVAALGGCASSNLKGVLSPIQLRMADPVLMKAGNGKLNPPIIMLQKYDHKTEERTTDYGGVVEEFVVERDKPQGKPRFAAFVMDSERGYKNRVDLVADSIYKVAVYLPNDFEQRRHELLTLKTETLYKAIEEADKKLRANTEAELRLLDEETRSSLIAAAERLRDAIARKQEEGIRQGLSQGAIDSATQGMVEQLVANERRLRDDDILRDRILPPMLVESLVDQIENWRTELNVLKGRIVSLELLMQNTNTPYPRQIHGWLQTKGQTAFTMSGAVPFVIEDEYLEWICQDRVVTIVAYDPNEEPEDPDAALRRAGLTEYWPQDRLMIIEFDDKQSAVARSAYAGTRPNTTIGENRYTDVTASRYKLESGVTRTYLSSRQGGKQWVFGPDVDPPRNIEVWTVDNAGQVKMKLYPPADRSSTDEVYIRQIAGVEGGAFSPIDEARRLGKIVAVARLGNKRETSDLWDIEKDYSDTLKKAEQE